MYTRVCVRVHGTVPPWLPSVALRRIALSSEELSVSAVDDNLAARVRAFFDVRRCYRDVFFRDINYKRHTQVVRYVRTRGTRAVVKEDRQTDREGGGRIHVVGLSICTSLLIIKDDSRNY